MTDRTTATQDSFFAALNVASVTDLAAVVQHVLEDTQPPLVIIGNISIEPIGGKDGGLDRATVEIITMFRGPKRSRLFEIQAAVRDALDGRAIAADGVILSAPVQTTSESDLLEDGVTYIGTQRFETIAQ